MKTIHIRPTGQLAPRVLLPGDPGRALALAQELLHQPKMFNHNRGLWGYTGSAKADELPLTIQSTGMGGPSAAIVLHELVQLGARTAVRVGTCGALLPSLRLGDLVVARAAIAADGVGGHLARSRADGTVHPTPRGASDAGRPATPGPGDATPHQRSEPIVDAHPALSHALEVAAQPAARGIIVTTDLFYEPSQSGREQRWRSAGALAVEMEAAALFAVGAELGIAVGCLLAVSDVFDADGHHHAEDEPLQHAAMRMGAAALTALSGAF